MKYRLAPQTRDILYLCPLIVFLHFVIASRYDSHPFRFTPVDPLPIVNGSDQAEPDVSLSLSQRLAEVLSEVNAGFTGTIGQPSARVEIDDDNIIDSTTGRPIEGSENLSFNLALLRLPRGSKWWFLGVARAPDLVYEQVRVGAEAVVARTLVAFGLNITSKGNPVIVSQPMTLDIAALPNEGCYRSNFYPYLTGAEDPRLFWTDAGTPGLIFGRPGSDPEHCRSLGFVADVRALYPDLVEAIKLGQGVSELSLINGIRRNQELRHDIQTNVEKNWAPFYPGSMQNASQLEPYISYKLAPTSLLQPTSSDRWQITYSEIEDTFGTQDCIARLHSDVSSGSIHQATPLYRLTLCDRGCEATEHNTVYIALAQVKKDWWHYEKFFITFNASEPFNVLSLGRRVKLYDLDDDNATNYAVTLSPLHPTELLEQEMDQVVPNSGCLPSHFFLDDMMVISLGHDDEAMGLIMVTVKEALMGHEMCTELGLKSGAAESVEK